MNTCMALVKRNTKLFFKDKGMFFASLITPAILLVLYVTFLGQVYRDSFASTLPETLKLPDRLLDGCVGGQLISSLLSVSCVTVAFCSNLLMVQDKANGSIRDFRISPVKSSSLAMGYYFASLLSALLVCLAAAGVCFLYIAAVGWYLQAADVLLLLGDIFLLTLFGTALSSVIHFFLSTQGQISAVGTIVSAGYGFVCGAYMPISQFSSGLQHVISFLPGTYGTSLIRNHAMRGVFAEMQQEGLPASVIDAMRDSVDCNLYFFDKKVGLPTMYLVLAGATALLIAVYILMNKYRKTK